jgi:phage-related baseplate assembly protein
MATSDLSASSAGTLSAVDLSRLPYPAELEPQSYESVLQTMVADVQAAALARTGSPYIFHEADPAYIVIEACATRRWRDLQDYQAQVKNMLLAYAQGQWLDQLGANPDFKCARLVIVPANPTANPPVQAVLETDEAYRMRLTLKNEGYTSAGSDGAYLFHALSASGDVLDASVRSPDAGVVEVRILSWAAGGIASPALIDTVAAALNDEYIRPICDLVNVLPAIVQTYTVSLNLTTYPGADIPSTLARARAAVRAYTEQHYKLGHDITRAGLLARAMVEGVQNGQVVSPAADLVTDVATARQCTGISVTHIGALL